MALPLSEYGRQRGGGGGTGQQDRQLWWGEDLRSYFPGPHTALQDSTVVEEVGNTMENRFFSNSDTEWVIPFDLF